MSGSSPTAADAREDVEAGKPASRPKPFLPDWPGFGPHFRAMSFDITIFWLLALASLVLYLKPPGLARPLLFVLYQDGLPDRLDIAVPYADEILDTYASAGIATGVPMFVILVVELGWIRSFRSLEAATGGFQMALVCTSFVTTVLKVTVGGLRPHFLAVCNPDHAMPGIGYANLYYTPIICNGSNAHDILEAQMSFPSGHASSAFAGAVYLCLWLNAVLKIFSGCRTSYWKLLVFFVPLLGAILLGLSKVADSYHHMSDVITGAAIGIFFALLAYRGAHASIWDWRYNHMPLSRTVPFDYEAPYVEVSDLRDFRARSPVENGG
ncbi:acid phosphatase/Vanadium-dependent haloperoxidase [Mytilinidion resinicola]|uniref:Acid phosphatase/Vanadium-dependent haloperoxidase n=1 Tax=Mytilinidion resinicola TaxID=574789 RepID=A0A6A6Z4X2_9PEZI|nr:acid phosphatase/Vanadium-dependent haloperoxidase [Mytilinidion resinicola]KAF2815789.1 acid phosphatase/Vanadium-dependent haloperoxidase [Mytilinidion resinicola]